MSPDFINTLCTYISKTRLISGHRFIIEKYSILHFQHTLKFWINNSLTPCIHMYIYLNYVIIFVYNFNTLWMYHGLLVADVLHNVIQYTQCNPYIFSSFYRNNSKKTSIIHVKMLSQFYDTARKTSAGIVHFLIIATDFVTYNPSTFGYRDIFLESYPVFISVFLHRRNCHHFEVSREIRRNIRERDMTKYKKNKRFM